MKFRLLITTVLLLVSMLLTSCGAATETPVATEALSFPPAPEFIEIGASIPLTGKFGSLAVR